MDSQELRDISEGIAELSENDETFIPHMSQRDAHEMGQFFRNVAQKNQHFMFRPAYIRDHDIGKKVRGMYAWWSDRSKMRSQTLRNVP